MSFSGIIGHDAAIERLRASIRSGRVAHGYIFAGPAGVGKTAVAAEFARALLCESGKDDSCGECVSCRKFEHGNHPGFEKVEPAGEGRLIKVELIEELHRTLASGARGEKYRVILIEPADRMRDAPANKFLKTLEEPPERVVFILITAQASALLDTIVSRCQMIRFGPVARDKVEKLLTTKHKARRDEARLAAAMSEGSPGKAIRLMDSGLAEKRDKMLEALLTLEPATAPDLVGTFVKQIGKGSQKLSEQREAARGLLGLMLYVYRDLLAVKLARKDYPLYSADRRDVVDEAAGRFDADDVIAIVDLVSEAITRIDANVNLEMLLDALVAGIARIGRRQNAAAS